MYIYNTFFGMKFFLKLNIILPIDLYTTIWLISAPYINQSTFGIVLDGNLGTPEIKELKNRSMWQRLNFFNFNS